MEVVYFQRKPRPNKNFSLEILFDQVRANLPSSIKFKIHVAKYYSNGFFNRLAISLDAMRNQSQINHVTGDIGFVAIFLKRKNTVLTILDVGSLNDANYLGRKILQWFWIQLPVYKAAYVTTISESAKNEILNYLNPKYESKIKVVYVPISSQFTFVAKNFNSSCPKILQIGTKENKNLNRLIEALNGIDCVLEIVGLLNSVQLSLLNKFKIKYINSVNLTDEQLRKKYEEADLVAFVSTYEGFGMPIVESQMVGRPVITSNLLSMPEVAGKGAHLVNPFDLADIRDGIKKIIQDEDYRNNLVNDGLVNAKRFSAKEISNEYAKIYEEIALLNHY